MQTQTASTQPNPSGSERFSSSSHAAQTERALEFDGADFYRSKDAGEIAALHPAQNNGARLATALGWFSIGLGIAQLLAPRRMAYASGVGSERTPLLRALGAREIASGVGILSRRQRPAWLWSRVAGDVMDIAILAAAARTAVGAQQRRRVAIAAAAVTGVTAADIWSSMRQSRELAATEVNIEKSIAINRPVNECYRFWRNFENFPRFMQHVQDVRVLSDTRSHWIVKAPAGTTVEWDAEITYDQPNQLLVWHSVEGSDIDHAGQIRFEPSVDGSSTVLHVEMQYRPPGGKAGALIAKLFGEEPEQQIEEDIRRFRQLIETGEIATTVGQSSGRRSIVGRLLRKGEPG